MTEIVIIGRFGKAHGIKGCIKVNSFTDPPENILNFLPWLIQKNNTWHPIDFSDCHHQGEIVVKLNDVNDRDLARTYTNIEIAIERSQLPQLPEGDYYWRDLEGLSVEDKTGKRLGKVDHLLATGANDVLVVKNKKSSYLIPYITSVVIKIDLVGKIIIVDWKPL